MNVPDQPDTTFIDIAACPTGPGQGDADSAPRGSDASKRNALSHALTAKKVFPPDLAAEIRECTAEITFAYLPETPYEKRLVAEMGRTQAQLARCRQLLVDDICRRSSRAVDQWDSDRREAALGLAEKLPNAPWLIKPALERSKQGVDWMIAEFTTLQTMTVQNGGWNERQRQRAFDLLGVRAEDREGFGIVPAATEVEAIRALVERELLRLGTLLKERLLGQDHEDQTRAVQGFPGPEDADTKRLRKYESKLKGDWNWARNELLWLRGVCTRPGATRPDHPGPMATLDEWLAWFGKTFDFELVPVPDPVPEPDPEPEPEPEVKPAELPQTATATPAEEPTPVPAPAPAATAASPAPESPANPSPPAAAAVSQPLPKAPKKPNSRQTDKGRKKRDARKKARKSTRRNRR